MSSDSPSSRDSLRCPTCGALQQASEICRRCKCDLSLILPVVRQLATTRQRCLEQLGQGDFSAAHRSALECVSLSRTPETERWVAVTGILAGKPQPALEILRQAGT